MVPTVEREFLTVLVCSMAMDGRMFSIESTFGLSSRSRNWRGVGAERLDVAALALGVEGVEDKRGFACAAQAGDGDVAAEGEIEVETLEVVLPDAAQADAAEVRCGRR